MVVHLDAADDGPRPSRLDDERVAGPDLAGPQRARDDRADPLQREDTVHREADRAGTTVRLGAAGHAVERGQQLVEAAPVPGADHDHIAASVRRAVEELAHVALRQLEELLIHRVRLRERDHAVTYSEQLEDREVFDRLRHHPVVRRHDEQEQVDARRPGHHRADEPLVAGHVDHAQPRA